MVEIKAIVYTQRFEGDVKRLRHGLLKEKLDGRLRKLVESPESGRPLRYGLRGEWTLSVRPCGLINSFQGDKLILLRFERRKKVYR